MHLRLVQNPPAARAAAPLVERADQFIAN